LDLNSQTDVVIKIKSFEASKSVAFGLEYIVCSQHHKNIVEFNECFLLEDHVWLSAEYMSAGNLTDIVSQLSVFNVTENMIAYICREV
jgi:hypothetical protein